MLVVNTLLLIWMISASVWVTPAASLVDPCDSDWDWVCGFCLKLEHIEGQNWDYFNNTCATNGARPMTVRNYAQWMYLKNQIASKQIWVGYFNFSNIS